ncbi:15092_t:CDS:1, partial [Cetraspora pellucida]
DNDNSTLLEIAEFLIKSDNESNNKFNNKNKSNNYKKNTNFEYNIDISYKEKNI